MDFTFFGATFAFIWLLHCIFKFYNSRKRIYAALARINGPKWYPIIGTTAEIMKCSREEFFKAYIKRNATYGPFFRGWIGFIPTVHLMKPEFVEPILSSATNITKAFNYRFAFPWLGNGLITASGPKWRQHRKLITPTFHFKVLDSMNDVFVEKSQILLDIVQQQGTNKPIDIFKLLTLCALDVICETAMGVEINAMKRSDSEYVKAVSGITDVIMYRVFNPHLHPDFIFNLTEKGRQHKKYLDILHGFTRKVIEQRKQKLEDDQVDQNDLNDEDILIGKKKRLAFLDLLLAANAKDHTGLTDEELREEVDTFMFAGHDTTTNTVSSTLLTLGNHPEIQSKVHEELDSIFHGEDRPITPQDLSEMQYLERVIKETLRLIPVVPVIARTLDTDVVVNGHVIPAGVTTVIHIYELHRDPEQYPNPERFDPDRFLPEQAKERHPYSFIPFSAGPRNCLGQKFALRSAKMMLATLLRRYKVKSMKKMEEMEYYNEIVLRPQNGVHVMFEER
uniref:Cytochrome P450 CYP4BM1 n=1 Tax=Epicauta chinensis TaxID=941254 RepID=A0A2C9DK10_9CUCU|nr:cytochrome P450 CYP4BM1 [Epicauta chinensis]